MNRIEESTLPPYDKEIPEAASELLATTTIERRGGEKRRASECLRPHMLRGIYNTSETNQTTEEATLNRLRRFDNKSMPTLSYRSNGLKRNKSNEMSQQTSQTFSLRRSIPRSMSQANATFDQIVKSPDAHQNNPVLGLLGKATSLATTGDSGNASFHFIQRRQNNPFLDRMMNCIHEESSSGNAVVETSATTATTSTSPLVPSLKAQSAPELDKNTVFVPFASECSVALNKDVQNRPQHDLNSQHAQYSSTAFLSRDCHPQTTLVSMLQEQGYQAQPRKYSQITNYFLEYTEEHIAKRGHFPFSYARRTHWEGWNKFLLGRKGNIHLRTFREPLSSNGEKSVIIG
jgi:hypothetical protein